MTEPIPVLICAYSRVQEFTTLLEQVIALKFSEIYINIDGATNAKISNRQSKMLEEISRAKLNNPEVKFYVRHSNSNLGAAVSIINSIDWFFSKVNFGIILEDDLFIGCDFVRFVSWAKIRFEFDDPLWIISGSNFFSSEIDLGNKIQFPMYPITWGWATWAKKWHLMRTEILQEGHKYLNKLPVKVKNFWLTGATRCRNGTIDAWDIPLAYYMRSNTKFSVIPPRNLVSNLGFTSYATHTHQQHYPLGLPVEDLANDFEITYSSKISAVNSEQYTKTLEDKVYKITFRNSFSFFFSRFDQILKRHKFKAGLRQRLANVQDVDFKYEIF